jgi:hypothetical protein
MYLQVQTGVVGQFSSQLRHICRLTGLHDGRTLGRNIRNGLGLGRKDFGGVARRAPAT